MASIAATTALSGQSAKPQVSPNELVQATVKNELAAANDTAIKFMFRSRKTTPKGVQNRIYVEANEALASALIGMNDKPLTPQQQRAETDHLQWLAGDREQLRHKQVREKEDEEHTLRIVRALPDAFRYEYVGSESGEAALGKAGDKLVRLKFTPNPAYSPPSHVEQVLQGMEGYLLIDSEAQRIARIDGTLFREVTFGWGIFGRLDKGSHFLVQQADAGDGHWVITQMSLRMTGKILLIKNLSIISDEAFSDFRRLPDDLPFARAVELLQSEEGRMVQSLRAAEPTETTRTPQ